MKHPEPDPSVVSLTPAEQAALGDIVRNYAEHQSWRCGYPDTYPWDDPKYDYDCPCGLVSALRKAGLPPEWAYLVSD